MLKMLAEFREFAIKGSVVDLAVGLILGTAFGAIVKSLVDDVIMPVASLALGGVDFGTRYWVIRDGGTLSGNETAAQAREEGATVVAYGAFVNIVITFLIVAWAVFLLVKAINRLRRLKEAGKAPTPTTRPCPRCLTDIPRLASRCKSCSADVEPTGGAP